MKRKKAVLSVLLFLMNFSLVHEYFFALYDNGHSSVSEYIAELEEPSDHKDLCDIHFEYHMPYILPQTSSLYSKILMSANHLFVDEKYDFLINPQFLKPPIS